ncbi:MAG: methyl-accepting chemotaxis protein [Burkholderiaceae bacterium]|nr:methyl-accepting chemotaxis protein [Burkholderiaceae bacterium]
MSSLTLSRRLWLPNLAVVATIVAAATVISLRTQDQIESNRQAQLDQLTTLEKVAQWAGLTEANAARTMAALASHDTMLGPRLEAEMSATSARISALQKDIEASSRDPEQRSALARVAETRKAYIDLRRQVLAERGEAAEVPTDRVQAVREQLGRYLEAQQAFVQLEHRRAEAQAEAAATERHRTVVGVIGLMLLVAGGLLWTTWSSVRAILQPLRRAQEVTDRIAAGDLTVRVDTSRRDEIGDLMRGLERMTTSLRQLVGEVRAGASGMQIASTEIATGNNDLSVRTEQTASSLQETAGAMAQLTSTVQQSADAAAQANQLASSAADTAARGGEVVAQVVSNMDAIAGSSRKIGDIIGVIDGIAFQTNILALNAAVEAARAGEQGRGFAVVAGEVRALAQRSAGAAREIKSLIGASMDTVEQGSKLVQDAGSTMTDLVASVRRVTDIIGEISASTREQNDGIRQVNQAVTRLDEMTQQNAALVEQSAAAADSMREQAQRLNQLVQRFETGSGELPASTASLPAAPLATASASRPAMLPKAPSARMPSPTPAPVAPQVATAAAAEASAAPAKASAALTAPNDDWETF